MKMSLAFSLVIMMALFGTVSAGQVITSPDGRIAIEIDLQSYQEPLPKGEFLSYRIRYNQEVVIPYSPISLSLHEQALLGTGLEITAIEQNRVQQTTELVAGKSRWLVDDCQEGIFYLREKSSPGRQLILTARAYDDAVAFRLHICRMREETEILVTQENTVIRGVSGTAYALRLKNFLTPYENNYDIIRLDQLNRERPVALPLLIQLDKGPWLAITEADLRDYPGMYLYPFTSEKNTLVSHLAPLRSDTTLSARLKTPHDLPWRVFLLGDDPGKFIESNVVLALSHPGVIENTSWIKPGKVAWDWWSDRVVEGRSFKGGMNTATMKYYIDFAAYAGLEYMLIDAKWYGAHDTPDEDITTAIPEIDLPEILAHAAKKNVGIWLWLNWQCVRDQMAVAFPLYQKWGIKGVKVDYMNCDDQDMVNFYEEVCRQAARCHLMVNFHGAYKPTGLRRTYPNLITREGVLGLEWSKWSDKCNPDHELILPYTRMLAGPMDFTPGAFNVASRKKFKIQYTEPMAMGTRAHQLAMYVVYESPAQMLVDHPASYFSQTGLEFLKAVPTTWDETRFIAGLVGDYIVLARRSGDIWYLGAMTDWTPRQLNIPLTFLKTGFYQVQIFRDGEQAGDDATRVDVVLQEVTSNSELKIDLVSGGGCAVRIIPTWAP